MTKRKKFGSRAKQDGDAEAGSNPSVFSDEFLRCKRCFASKGVYGEPDVPTLMARSVVRLKVQDGPNLDVGVVVRCGNADCNYIHEARPFRAAADHGITKSMMLLAAAGCRGELTFTAEEFKKYNMPYNPNQHIEPMRQQEELPL